MNFLISTQIFSCLFLIIFVNRPHNTFVKTYKTENIEVGKMHAAGIVFIFSITVHLQTLVIALTHFFLGIPSKKRLVPCF